MELYRSSKESNELKNECIQKFLAAYPRAFADRHYQELERNKKWHDHERWQGSLSLNEFKRLLMNRDYDVIATRALSVENRTDFLDPEAKMGLRDAIKDRDGAEVFAKSLYQLLHGTGTMEARFNKWVLAFNELPGIKSRGVAPRNKNRIVAWEVLTVFPFLSHPQIHVYLQPDVALTAARSYGYNLHLEERPSWLGYSRYLKFCEAIRVDLRALRPKDLLDIQNFIWIIGREMH